MLGVTIFTIIAGEFVVNGLAILIAKTLGTTLSVLGILDRFVDLLTVLGVMLPPIIGIMLVDYYLLRGSRKILDDSQLTGKLPDETVTIGWAAICASIVGGIVGLVTEWGVPTINSLLACHTALLGAKAGVQPLAKVGHHARSSVIIEPPYAGANY